ncbi:hypothetical protein ACWDYH_25705 [Nocardia goodfellowii]
MQRFEAVIEAGARGGAYVPVPPEVMSALGRGGPTPGRARNSCTDRRQLVAAITEAMRPEFRARRIEKAVAASS